MYMGKTNINLLKASVDKLNNLANDNDEIPTDGVLLPIGKTPTQREVIYYKHECLNLIDNWSSTITNENILDTLNVIKSNLDEIYEN